MNYTKLRGLYGRLVGLSESLSDTQRAGYCFEAIFANDYNSIVDEVSKLIKGNLDSYKIPGDQFFTYDNDGIFYVRDTFVVRIKQFIYFLRYTYSLDEKMLEVGSLINTIQNQELKDRCLDLLSARGKFDRVINQATLVLEDIVRQKSGITNKEGTKLINEVFKEKAEESILRIEGEPEEHQGFGHICRGIMLGFRNLTHHKLIDKFSREDALKFCGFVDVLLKLVDLSRKNQ